jgi:hypothetical protein
MTPTSSDFVLLPLLIDIVYGVFALIFILMFHGGSINFIVMRFEHLTSNNLKLRQFHRVFFHFYSAFIFIALIHISEIVIWGFYIFQLKLIPSLVDSIIFAGSCYTTVGFIPDILPNGWKSLAFFISFTGLFTLAWTTSAMIILTGTYKTAYKERYGRHSEKSNPPS